MVNAPRKSVQPVTAGLAALSRLGTPGREAAARLDLLRAAGAGRMLRRWRDEVHERGLPGANGSSPFRTIWEDAAEELDATVRDVGGGFLEFEAGRKRTRVWNYWVPLDDVVTVRLALEKDVVHALVAEAGVQTPEHRTVRRDDLKPAFEFVEASPGPYVVKPNSAYAGTGVTSGVATRSQLVRAAIRAGRASERLLVERQIEGESYRLLLLDGEVLGVVRRRPPAVVGDGSSTIGALIATENRRRRDAIYHGPIHRLNIDLECVFTLERQGLTLDSVLAPGTRVHVKDVVSQNAPEENETVETAEVGAELVAETRRAAAAVGVRLAGVDLITTEVGSSLRETSGAIIEVNATPGLQYHYQVREPAQATRVAVPILRALLDR
jgi:D-alanine-D-alanine ligase-like ATP-grasp enzyme